MLMYLYLCHHDLSMRRACARTWCTYACACRRKHRCETRAAENPIASSTTPCGLVGPATTERARLFTACFSSDFIDREHVCSIKPLFSPRSGIDLPKRFERERASERKSRLIFLSGASDKPPEYVDLQIKKFTSVSRVRPFQSPKRIKISNIFHGYGTTMAAATTAAATAAAASLQKFAIIYGAVSARRNFFFFDLIGYG